MRRPCGDSNLRCYIPGASHSGASHFLFGAGWSIDKNFFGAGSSNGAGSPGLLSVCVEPPQACSKRKKRQANAGQSSIERKDPHAGRESTREGERCARRGDEEGPMLPDIVRRDLS